MISFATLVLLILTFSKKEK
ncbi:hypothetical protein [Paenibacillus abyssi]